MGLFAFGVVTRIFGGDVLMLFEFLAEISSDHGNVPCLYDDSQIGDGLPPEDQSISGFLYILPR